MFSNFQICRWRDGYAWGSGSGRIWCFSHCCLLRFHFICWIMGACIFHRSSVLSITLLFLISFKWIILVSQVHLCQIRKKCKQCHSQQHWPWKWWCPKYLRCGLLRISTVKTNANTRLLGRDDFVIRRFRTKGLDHFAESLLHYDLPKMNLWSRCTCWQDSFLGLIMQIIQLLAVFMWPLM